MNGVVFLLIFCLIKAVTCQVDWLRHKPKICIKDEGYVYKNNGKTRNVYLSLFILSLDDINENTMDYGLNLYVLEVWSDPELNLMTNISIPKSERIPHFVSECIWKPDTIFNIIEEDHLYDAIFPNVIYKVLPGGYIHRITRYRLLVSCSMSFHNYPMDKQMCPLFITLMGTSQEEATMQWFSGKDTPKPLPQFEPIMMFQTFMSSKFIIEIPLTASSVKFLEGMGNSTFLLAVFSFERRLSASLVKSYVPSSTIVCLSWISFWLDADAVPGRVTLGITALLTLYTQMIYARSSLPTLHYMTALDVWLLGCLVMVSLSLMEFTVANMHSRHRFRIRMPTGPKAKSVIRAVQNWTEKFSQPLTEHHPESIRRTTISPPRPPIARPYRFNVFDRWSRVLFPGLTLIFSIAYWIHYLSNPGGIDPYALHRHI